MKIKALRLKKGMSQSEIGIETGVSQQAVAKWESGQSEPDLKTLIKLSNIFGCSVDEIVKEGD